MRFQKYQALGNDYLVIRPEEIENQLTPKLIRELCDRHYGIGADGVLVGPIMGESGRIELRIFNPDGSEAEKSGNGIRIFGKFLYDKKIVSAKPFQIKTKGGDVLVSVKDLGNQILVNMGKVSFWSQDIPVIGKNRMVIDEKMTIGEFEVIFTGVTLGNPHCVVFVDDLDFSNIQEMGPLIENHKLFPSKTNVQFVKVLGRSSIQIEIWERGAGYTLSSGSSACAATAAAVRSGYCDSKVNVQMPGGKLSVEINDYFEVTQIGPASLVFSGVW